MLPLYTAPPLKSLTTQVRFAILIISGYVSTAHSQNSIEHVLQNPEPASVVQEKLDDVKQHENQPSAEPPYCNDTPDDVLKSYPQGSTSAVSDKLKGAMNDTLILSGEACIVRDDVKIQGDTIQYDYPTEQVTATGNAILHTNNGDEISGPLVNYNLSTETGQVDSAEFKIGEVNGQGKAESLTILSSRRALMKKVYYTTCRAEDPDWYIKNDLLLVDQDSDTGMGENSVLVFKGVPILASPYMEFPLGNRRKSGWLTPVVGYSSSSGAETVLPYYVNLAPNYDLVLYPGFLSERGAKLGANYRYLTKNSYGNLYANFLYDDQTARKNQITWNTTNLNEVKTGHHIPSTNRWYWQAKHQTNVALDKGILAAYIDAKSTSDNTYLEDFNEPGIDSATRILPSEYAMQYSNDNWQIRARAKNNQTLQDESNSIDVPYDLEPQISILGSEQIDNWVVGLDAESTHFTHPDKDNRAEGWRHVINPSLLYDYRTAGIFITPKIGAHLTKYNLSSIPQNTSMNGTKNYNPNAHRILPILSVDSGLVLERNNTSWLGKAAVQTLEPRLYYLYVPYKNQSNIWNFDSNIADFSLSRIYGDNIFTGRDRISNANQTTAGLTSRWLAKETGEELFQITAAQRYYFEEQYVTLPNSISDTSRKSDLLLSAYGAIRKSLRLNSFVQYNMDINKIQKSEFSLQWQPAPKKILNIGFSNNNLTSAPSRNVYISGELPISQVSKNLYGVARVNYDTLNNQLSDAFVGFEYIKDCWIFRLVSSRSIASSTKTNNSIYFQLELKGLGALGNDPITTIQDGISGYQAVKFED